MKLFEGETMTTIRWGVLGLGKTTDRFIEGLKLSGEGELVAVASRTASKRDAYATRFPQAKVYEDYTKMLADPTIDAIYITLRHADHYTWAKAALLADKAVLCEKPATLSGEETSDLARIAKERQVFFLEALKTRFMPLTHTLHTLIDEGVIGQITQLENAFCYDIPYDPNSYLFDLKQGGILYDVGTYTLGSALDFIREPLVDVKVETRIHQGVDVYDHVTLTFQSGATASLKMAMDRNMPRDMVMTGTLGEIRMANFHRPQQVEVRLNNGEKQVLSEPCDDFLGEIEAVHQGIRNHQSESAHLTHQDSIDIVDAMVRIKTLIDQEKR